MVFSHSQPARTVILSWCKQGRWPITLSCHQSTNYTNLPQLLSPESEIIKKGNIIEMMQVFGQKGVLQHLSRVHLHQEYKYSIWACESDGTEWGVMRVHMFSILTGISTVGGGQVLLQPRGSWGRVWGEWKWMPESLFNDSGAVLMLCLGPWDLMWLINKLLICTMCLQHLWAGCRMMRK